MHTVRRSISIILAVGFLLSPYLSSAEERLTGIAVTGECLKKIPRDRAAVTISSSIVAPTAKDSSKKATEAHEVIKTEVRALKLQNLTVATANYSVDQECTYGGKISGRVCEGYRTTISTRFETPNVVDLEEIIGIASKRGAENVSNLAAFASPESLKNERESCLEIATKDANAKARKIAAGAGVQLGKLISVAEGASESAPPFVARGAMPMSVPESSAAKGLPTIDAQPIDLRVAVNAVYGIQ
jgi:uncharacterized protein YggE